MSILFLLVCLCLPFHGQEQQSGNDVSAEWLINLPSSPVVLGIQLEGRTVTLASRAYEHTSLLKFGCIAHQGSRYIVVEELQDDDMDVAAPEDGTFTRIYIPAEEFADDRERCEQRQAKVGVFEVEFVDGAIWTLKR